MNIHLFYISIIIGVIVWYQIWFFRLRSVYNQTFEQQEEANLKLLQQNHNDHLELDEYLDLLGGSND